jgi:hypothetical protein
MSKYFLICKITFRVFTFLGQASVHLPHNIHFSISLATASISPLITKRLIFRKLKVVNCDAEQVAEQVPQEMQVSKLGSCFVRNSAKELSISSKFSDLSLLIVYPKFTIFYNLEL